MVAVAVLGLAGSGAVAQGVSFSGEGDLGVIYAGDTTNDDGKTTANSKFTWVSNFDLAMSASGTTDGGLTFGAGATVKAGNASSEVGKSNAYIGGESWKISIGDLDPATHKGRSINDVGFDGLGVDDVAEGAVDSLDADVEVSFSLGAASLAITVDQTPGVAVGDDLDGKEWTNDPAGLDDVTKQSTEWAAGVGFAIGSTSLGLGMDSKKLMQASIGADLGAFGGSLFFAQQKEKSLTEMGKTDRGVGMRDNLAAVESGDDERTAGIFHSSAEGVDNRTITNKKTGIGVEITVSAGPNTTINAVYAQGKNSDTRVLSSYCWDTSATAICEANTDEANKDQISDLVSGEEGDMDRANSAISKTNKGFGVGVSHNLGGGATLKAGFAKVKKQTMASVGVSMSF